VRTLVVIVQLLVFGATCWHQRVTEDGEIGGGAAGEQPPCAMPAAAVANRDQVLADYWVLQPVLERPTDKGLPPICLYLLPLCPQSHLQLHHQSARRFQGPHPPAEGIC